MGVAQKVKYAIILAGGGGSRFWPLSRQAHPKQFLSIYSDKSQIQETIERILPRVKIENIYVAVNKDHKELLKKSLKDYPFCRRNLFFEPKGKSTLAPSAFLARKIHSVDKKAIIAVLPADHFIKDSEKFSLLFDRGIAAAKEGHIVTLGIRPLRPETGYGYIKAKKDGKSKFYFEVEKFVEKPKLARAKSFLKDGRYYWNSGIFFFRADVFLKELQRFLPDMYNCVIKMQNGWDQLKLWSGLPSLSIDYGLMEKTDRAVVLPAECGWVDLGSWEALAGLMEKDANGNTFRGSCLDIGSRDTFIWSDKGLIATIGLKDIVIVQKEGTLLVCHKKKSQHVKQLVDALKKSDLKERL